MMKIESLLIDYLPILIFFAIACVLAIALVILPFILSGGKSYKEQTSQYECGFEAFSGARAPFDVRFYLVSILFIIFDLEIAFLFPWAITLDALPLLGFFSMIFFLFVLTVGFIYEWRKGALEWK
ncbi:MAG: NADH-quinone oxidoreductase subunit A [Alphaproteobacteria bacterium]|nr:NADH-quinone oxidoreductase subunit A [Candidatus Jidaibacter sp.]